VRDIEEDVKRDYAETEPGDDTQDKLDALDDLLDDSEVRAALLDKMSEA
jgi:hypothetical protein